MSNFVNEIIRCSGQNDVFVDARRFFRSSRFIEQKLVGFVFPGPKTGTGSRATSAALFAVTAVIFTKFLFDVEWLEAALDMVITNYVMWTANDATRTSGAKARGNHFFVELFPLECPRSGFGVSVLVSARAMPMRIR